MSWNFGYEVVGSSASGITTRICGSKFSNPTAGEAQSITACLSAINGNKYKCAIYDAALNKVGETEEWTCPSTAKAWHTFNFISKPNLGVADYVICATANGGDYLWRDADVGVDRWYEEHAYNSWPASLSASDRTGKFSIYCTLEEAVITHEWEGSDSIAIGEALVKTPMKMLSDGIQFSDVVVKEFQKVISDGIAFTDVVVRLWTHVRTFTDSIAFTDTLVKSMSKVLSDSIAFKDLVCTVFVGKLIRTLTAVRNNVAVRIVSKIRDCWCR